jgi:hypothetical protein
MNRKKKAVAPVLILCSCLLLFQRLSGQDNPNDYPTVHPNQRIEISHLAPVSSVDKDSPSTARAALVTVLSAGKIQCDRDSAFERIADANSRESLATLATKISGATCLVDGRKSSMAVNFVSNANIQGNGIVASLKQGMPLLMEWRSTLYVLYGVVYDERIYSSGRQDNFIREFLLIDPRYSDRQQLATFDRGKDNFTEVTGIASVSLSAK